MNSFRISTRLLPAMFLVLGATACGGGSGESAPKPLVHRLDDMYIARVPIADKQNVLEAQNDYSLAKMEHAKVEADLQEIGTKIVVARNEQKQRLLDEQSAHSEKKAADKSADMNRVNSAVRKMRIAELERKAADRKVEYLKAKRAALRKYLRYTVEQMYAKEAAYELAKAQVAHDNNIRPKGFQYRAFQQQAQKRATDAQKAKAASDKAMQVVKQKQKEWQGLIQEAVAAGGSAPSQSAASAGTEDQGGTESPPPAQPTIKSMPDTSQSGGGAGASSGSGGAGASSGSAGASSGSGGGAGASSGSSGGAQAGSGGSGGAQAGSGSGGAQAGSGDGAGNSGANSQPAATKGKSGN